MVIQSMTPGEILLWALVGALAAYRAAYFFTADTGPWRIAERIRSGVTARFGADSWQAEGATCAFCQSVWYALIAALALFGLPTGLLLNLLRLGALGLAMAGLVLILHWLVLTWIGSVNRS